MDRGGGAGDTLNYVVRKPVGVVGLVTPWNLPLYLLSWARPALAMGNGHGKTLRADTDHGVDAL